MKSRFATGKGRPEPSLSASTPAAKPAIRRFAALAGVGLTAALAAAPSSRAAVTLPSNPVVEMRVDYEPPAGSLGKLAGFFDFWTQQGSDVEGPVAAFDIGPLKSGKLSQFTYFTEPHCARSVCDLLFSFGGMAGTFPAEAFPTGMTPGATPPPDPLIRLVGPSDFNFLLHNGVLEYSGPIFAWDNPVQVGTWSAKVFIPEPATWAMMLVGFGWIGGTMRSRRRAAPAA
jgi:hypothetical protein